MKRFSDGEMLKRLERPEGKVLTILDTDTYNEIDDQFAIAYMLLTPEKFDVRAITAAPFHAPVMNNKSDSPADGMLRSYDEIIKLLKIMKRDDLIPSVYKGSGSWLADENTPVESDAARKIVETALENKDKTVYVIAIGAITNVASALLMCPDIADNIVVVWLGGHSTEWIDTMEFNMFQDIAAARVLFDSGAPVVQLPCLGVVSHLSTTGPELTAGLKGKNPLCDYLVDNVVNEVSSYAGDSCWSRVIWDVSAIAWFLDPKFMGDKIIHSPVVTYDYKYSQDFRRHFSKYIFFVNRDAIFTDLFKKLASFS